MRSPYQWLLDIFRRVAGTKNLQRTINHVCGDLGYQDCRLAGIQSEMQKTAQQISNLQRIVEPAEVGYRIEGDGNRVVIMENGIERTLSATEKLPGLDIDIIGNGNTVRIEQPINFQISRIHIRSNHNSVHIEPSPQLHLVLDCWSGDHQKFRWGRGSDTSWELKVYMCGEESSVTIGEDCMFAGEIYIWSSEPHAILDLNSGEVLNLSNPGVAIGNHCWVGQGVRITKRGAIPDNTIVGLDSIVTRRFTQEHTAIGGNPAVVLKHDVSWDRKAPHKIDRQPKETLIDAVTGCDA